MPCFCCFWVLAFLSRRPIPWMCFWLSRRPPLSLWRYRDGRSYTFYRQREWNSIISSPLKKQPNNLIASTMTIGSSLYFIDSFLWFTFTVNQSRKLNCPSRSDTPELNFWAYLLSVPLQRSSLRYSSLLIDHRKRRSCISISAVTSSKIGNSVYGPLLSL